MNRNDSEINKFALNEIDKVAIKVSQQLYGGEISGNENINDLESLKFDGENIRIVTSI